MFMFSIQLPVPAPFLFKDIASTIYPHRLKPRSFTHKPHPPPSTRLISHSSFLEAADVAAQGQSSQTEEEEEEERVLPPELRHELMPKHVAVIMDGNVRWARRRGLPGSMGHAAGVRSLNGLIDMCGRWGIRVLTVFAFSEDNWSRPKAEIEFLMRLFESEILSKLQEFMRKGIRVSVIGDTSRLPVSLQKGIVRAEETTKNNTKLHFIMAISYSGKYDIVQACRKIAQKVKDDLIDIEDIDAGIIEQELETVCTEFPSPDLLIRTSGELRVSNFLLWQLAYSELFFGSALWPDFGEEDFVAALVSFQQRDRRYGRREVAASNS